MGFNYKLCAKYQKLIILFLIIFFTSCDNNNKNDKEIQSPKIIKGEKIGTYSKNLNGIFIFQKGMQFNQLLDSLTERNIAYKLLSPDEYLFDELANRYQYCKEFKAIRAFNVTFSDINLDECEIGFYNNEILYVYYIKNIRCSKENKDNFSKIIYMHFSNIYGLYKGLIYKYGKPISEYGDLNFGNEKKYSYTSDNISNVYVATWISLDTAVNVELYNRTQNTTSGELILDESEMVDNHMIFTSESVSRFKLTFKKNTVSAYNCSEIEEKHLEQINSIKEKVKQKENQDSIKNSYKNF